MPAFHPVGPLLRRAASAGTALVAAACANPRAEQAAMAPALFVGMPKQTLLSCAGVPDRSATVDNLEFFTYSSQRVVTYPTGSLSVFGSRYHRGFGYGPGFPFYGGYGGYGDYDVRYASCEATFTLRNGIVERLVYGGDGSGGADRLGQCYAIVENCLALVPRATAPATGIPAVPQPGAVPPRTPPIGS